MPKAENTPEPEHRDRLEVLGHQLRLPSRRKLVQQLCNERLDQLGCARLYDAGSQRRIEHGAKLLLPLAVEDEDALAAHRAIERGRGHA